MPYCKRCSASCELINVQPTPSQYIQQGNCVRCNSVVYFFTNLPAETYVPPPEESSATSSRKKSRKPARGRQPSRSRASSKPNTARVEPVALGEVKVKPARNAPSLRAMPNEPVQLTLAGITVDARTLQQWGLIALLLTITVYLLLTNITWGQPLAGTARAEKTFVVVTNASIQDWKNVKLALNGKYHFTMQNHDANLTIPGHGTSYFAYAQFTTSHGKSFDPKAEKPKTLLIEGKSAHGESVSGELELRMNGD